MPFVNVLAGLLLRLCAPLVGRVLLALGMGYVTYKGVGAGIDWLLMQIKMNIGAMPTQAVQLLAYLWVDKAISMMFSAYAAAALIKLGTSGVLTRLVTKGA
ncbi:DUF2523 domain-containing protein [Pseudoduganella sp. R-34]|uniref:DUF2523 domain-containing protein n=1 Tax=Pseudoduganella sp. R-34 TaxID=3404062 RepID=UPI003CE79B88